jgi:hypothetical protein
MAKCIHRRFTGAMYAGFEVLGDILVILRTVTQFNLALVGSELFRYSMECGDPLPVLET